MSVSFFVLFALPLVFCQGEEYSLPPPVFSSNQTIHDLSGRSLPHEFRVPETRWPEHGIPYDATKEHFPTYYERASGLWINYVRIAPIYFRDTWLKYHITDNTYTNVFDTENFPSTAPGFHHLNLNRVARAHAYNRRHVCWHCESTTCTNIRKDCNGTTMYQTCEQGHSSGSCYSRIIRYAGYPSGSSFQFYEIDSEDPPGVGLNRGYGAIATAVCGGVHFPHNDGSVDLGGCVGDEVCLKYNSYCNDRTTIMRLCNQWGCGFEGVTDPDTPHNAFHTCDCNSSATNVYYQYYSNNTYHKYRIATAAHVAVPTEYTTKYMYVVTVKGTETTPAPELYVDSKTVALTAKFIGNEGIVYESDHFDISPSLPCSYYYVTLGSERYPKKGYFGTYYLGQCRVDYAKSMPSQCTSGDCCETSTNQFKPSTAKCRDEGACVKPANCSGTSQDCPKIEYKSNITKCYEALGSCDNDVFCSGTSDVCVNGTTFKPDGTPCDGGICNGTSPYCGKEEPIILPSSSSSSPSSSSGHSSSPSSSGHSSSPSSSGHSSSPSSSGHSSSPSSSGEFSLFSKGSVLNNSPSNYVPVAVLLVLSSLLQALLCSCYF